MAGGTTPAHVTQCYKGLIDVLVIDHADAPAAADVPLVVSDILIGDRAQPVGLPRHPRGGFVKIALIGGTGELLARRLPSGSALPATTS